jgi:hypothetical protein
VLTNAALDRPRINLKNDQVYAITAGIVHAIAGPVKNQGYTTTYGDGTKAVIDGGTVGASFVLFSNSNAQMFYWEDVIFQNNGASGVAGLVEHITGGNSHALWRRCVFRHGRGAGLLLAQGAHQFVVECEAYGCNQSNTANLGGFLVNALGVRFIRCLSHHHNSGIHGHGLVTAQHVNLIDSIFSANGGAGVKATGAVSLLIRGCDIRGNALDGVLDAASGGNTVYYVENSNFLANGGWGLNLVSTSQLQAMLVNCGFGSGDQLNISGNVNIAAPDLLEQFGTVTYPADATPWVDPAGGDFRIRHAMAKNAGRGTFMTEYPSWSAPNTRGYPDIGAAAHQDMSVQPTYGIGV